MKSFRLSVILVMALLGTSLAADADAYGSRHRHHGGGGHRGSSVHFGLTFGAPAFGYGYAAPYYYRPYYYRPYYSYPAYYPPVVVREAPTVYVEREQPAAAPEPASAYWYYCPDSQAYYPYVTQCAGPWQRVTPQPPPS